MNGGEEGGGEGMNKGEGGGPFVDAPHLSAGSFTLQSVEAPPFTAGCEEGGGEGMKGGETGGGGNLNDEKKPVAVRRPPRRDSRLRRWGKVLAVVVAFYAAWLVGWELLARTGFWPTYIFPRAIPVLETIWANFVNGHFPEAILASLRRLAVGYLIALGIGLGLGVLMGRVQTAQLTIGSVALGMQALPSIAWLPLALIWFGLDETAIIFVIVMGVVFSVAMATATGIRSIPPQLERAARNLGARGASLLTDLVLPASLPQMVSGMKQGWSFAWRSLIAAEMVYSTVGLGHLLWVGREFSDLTLVLAVMVVIVLVGLAADQLLFERLERAVHARWGVARR